MHKLLDYLNGRSFSINSLEGSEKVLEHFLGDNKNRLEHSKRVTKNMWNLLKKNPTRDYASSEKLLIASNLHDIGYSEKLFLSGFHPYDGYIYLKENGWDIQICNLVLLHSYSRELCMTHSPELYNILMNAEQSTNLDDIAILSLADFTASSSGESVTINKRIEDICKRYPKESPISNHAKLVKRLLYSNDTTLKLLIELDLNY